MQLDPHYNFHLSNGQFYVDDATASEKQSTLQALTKIANILKNHVEYASDPKVLIEHPNPWEKQPLHEALLNYASRIKKEYDREQVVPSALSYEQQQITTIFLKIIKLATTNPAIPEFEAQPTKLSFALEIGNVEEAFALIDKGEDLNGMNPTNRLLPFTEAIRIGNQELIEKMIKKGVNLNLKTSRGNFLHDVIYYRNSALLRFLIEQGVPLEVRNRMGNTPLCHAISMLKGNAANPQLYEEYMKMIKILIESGADLNSKDIHNRTVLRFAQALGLAEVVNFIRNFRAKKKIS